MGRFNELIGGAASYSRALALALGQEEQEGVTTVAPEIVPTFDLWGPLENWLLFDGMPWGIRQVSAALAANFSTVFLRNPAGSGLLIRVQRIANLTGNTLRIGIGGGATASDGSNSIVPLDTRRFVNPGPTAHFRQQVADPMSDEWCRLTSFVDGGSVVESPEGLLILAPGRDLLVTPTGLAQGCEVAFHGRLRRALPRELSL